MPTASVVVGTGEAAENALGIHAGAKGGNDLRAASAEMLGQGQNCWRHRHCGMAGHGGMNVVVVVGMGRPEPLNSAAWRTEARPERPRSWAWG